MRIWAELLVSVDTFAGSWDCIVFLYKVLIQLYIFKVHIDSLMIYCVIFTSKISHVAQVLGK